MKQNIEIEISKTKSLLALLGCIGFVLISIWFICNPEQFINWKNRSENIILFIGIIGAITFSFFGFFILKKIFDTKKGLIITKDGIIDNSSAISIGIVYWNDMKKIEVHNVASTKFLILILVDPHKYIELAKNKFSKQAMKANYKLYGLPIAISSNSLKISFSKLEALIVKEFKKYNNKNVV